MRKPVRKVKVPAKRPAAKPAASSSKVRRSSAKSPSGFQRGSSGFKVGAEKRQRQDEEYQRKRETPFAYRLKPGEEGEVIVLDKGEPFFLNLHKVKQGKGWGDEVCIADTGQRCPLCESTGKEGSYTMVLTVLDNRPYRVKSGPNQGKLIKVSKKLLLVKGRNLPKFQRQYEGKYKGNFRGMKILCRRDGDKESAMGEDLEFKGRVPEASLVKFKENSVAADYTKIFAMPTAEELRKRYSLGKSNVAGASEFDDKDEEDDYDMGDVGWDTDEDEE